MAVLDVDRLQGFRIPSHSESYDPRQVILYALGTGAGLSRDIDETSLLFERDLRVLPTLALVLGTAGFWPMAPGAGLDWKRVLHGSQTLRLARPLAADDSVAGTTNIIDIADKGPGKSALVRARRTLSSLSGMPVAEMDETWILRKAGGFGGAPNLSDFRRESVPDRRAERQIDVPTALNQAAIYRLSGDRNPLHIDGATAREAGFDRPILHGLSTMGLAARALSHLCCGGDPTRLSSMEVQFTAPVLPGEMLRVEVWQDAAAIWFRVSAPERDVVVIDGGKATLDMFRPI